AIENLVEEREESWGPSVGLVIHGDELGDQIRAPVGPEVAALPKVESPVEEVERPGISVELLGFHRDAGLGLGERDHCSEARLAFGLAAVLHETPPVVLVVVVGVRGLREISTDGRLRASDDLPGLIVRPAGAVPDQPPVPGVVVVDIITMIRGEPPGVLRVGEVLEAFAAVALDVCCPTLDFAGHAAASAANVETSSHAVASSSAHTSGRGPHAVATRRARATTR